MEWKSVFDYIIIITFLRRAMVERLRNNLFVLKDRI